MSSNVFTARSGHLLRSCKGLPLLCCTARCFFGRPGATTSTGAVRRQPPAHPSIVFLCHLSASRLERPLEHRHGSTASTACLARREKKGRGPSARLTLSSAKFGSQSRAPPPPAHLATQPRGPRLETLTSQAATLPNPACSSASSRLRQKAQYEPCSLLTRRVPRPAA